MPRESVLKPHYQLLGVLLERRELRSNLLEIVRRPQSSYVPKDVALDEITYQLSVLDSEIREYYSSAVTLFRRMGRSEDDLIEFVGEDLLDELSVVEALVETY